MNAAKVRATCVAGLVLTGLVAAGCGRRSSSGSIAPQEADHLRQAARLVTQYQQATKKRPATIDEVRDWAVQEGKAGQEDFVSTRDKQPYGIALTPMGVVVYEQSGQQGKCYIMRAGGVAQVPADEVRQLAKQGELGPKGKPRSKKDKPAN